RSGFALRAVDAGSFRHLDDANLHASRRRAAEADLQGTSPSSLNSFWLEAGRVLVRNRSQLGDSAGEAATERSPGILKQKERNARLHVLVGKPAIARAARSHDANAGALGGDGVQRVSDGRHGARPDHRRVAARPGFHSGRESVEAGARTGKGWREDTRRRRK